MNEWMGPFPKKKCLSMRLQSARFRNRVPDKHQMFVAYNLVMTKKASLAIDDCGILLSSNSNVWLLYSLLYIKIEEVTEKFTKIWLYWCLINKKMMDEWVVSFLIRSLVFQFMARFWKEETRTNWIYVRKTHQLTSMAWKHQIVIKKAAVY